MNSSCHKAAHLHHSPQKHDEVSVTGETSQSIDSFTANKLHFLPVNTHSVQMHKPLGLEVTSVLMLTDDDGIGDDGGNKSASGKEERL